MHQMTAIILAIGFLSKAISFGFDYSSTRNITQSSWDTIQSKKLAARIADGIAALCLTFGLVLGLTELLLN